MLASDIFLRNYLKGLNMVASQHTASNGAQNRIIKLYY